jgi:site-specific DNA-cytosine methylase
MSLLLELFCGTHSVGREFHAAGWEVYSVDIDPARHATWTGDVREFDPATLPRKPDFIRASSVCTHYSVARMYAKTPRDLEWADSLVLAALRTQEACGCPMLMENPYSSMLKRTSLHARCRPCRRLLQVVERGLPAQVPEANRHLSHWS